MANYDGSISNTMTQNNSIIISPINTYTIGLIRDTNIDNCLSFDGKTLSLSKCPVALTDYNNTFRFKFQNGEIRDISENYCFVRNRNLEFSFEKVNTFSSGDNNCYKFLTTASFPLLSDKGSTCFGNNIDKMMSLPCSASNWKMTLNV